MKPKRRRLRLDEPPVKNRAPERATEAEAEQETEEEAGWTEEELEQYRVWRIKERLA